MSKKQATKYFIPYILQKVVVFGVGGLFILQFFSMLQQGFMQYQQNSHIGGFYGFFFTMELLPILFFALAYALNPRNLKTLSRCFESMVLALSGVISWSLIGMISPTIFLINGPRFIESYARYQIVASSILLLIFTLILLWMRLSRRWQ